MFKWKPGKLAWLKGKWKLPSMAGAYSADGWGRVLMPNALDRKYPNAPKEWRWQWVFPQENRWKNTKTGEEGRHHTHETILQRGVKEAVRNAAYLSMSVVTPSDIPFPCICLKQAMTSAPFRNSLGTRMSARP